MKVPKLLLPRSLWFAIAMVVVSCIVVFCTDTPAWIIRVGLSTTGGIVLGHVMATKYPNISKWEWVEYGLWFLFIAIIYLETFALIERGTASAVLTSLACLLLLVELVKK